MNKVIESLKNSKFSQLFGQPIKSFFSMVNQVDIPNYEDDNKYRSSLDETDKAIDNELKNALKDVETIEKNKKIFDSIREKNISETKIQDNNENKSNYEKNNIKHEIEREERDI